MSISYRLIAPDDLDAALIDVWRAIQSKTGAFANPYFCPEFTQLVGKVRDDARVVVIENDRRIVGFFPHQRSFLGLGKPIGGALSDYHGVIAEPDCAWDVEPLMQAAKLSVWNFNHLVDEAGKFVSYVEMRTSSPQIDLSSGYTQYVAGRRDAGSDYIKKTEGLARKLAREVGELRFTLHEPENDVIKQLIRWKSAQYRESRLPDVFAVPWTGDLLNRIANTQTVNFSGVCSVLRVGDHIAAIHLGMRSDNILHYWYPAYDPEFAKFSTGIILLLRMAEALAGMGVEVIDLGEGKSQYKERLMTSEVPLQKGFIELPSLLATARQLQRAAETHAEHGGLAAAIRLPLKAIRRFAWLRKFH